MEEDIKKALDEIRPALQADGGDVEYVGMDGDVVQVMRESDYNKNWEAEIEAYDKECQSREKFFLDKCMIIPQSGTDKLTPEENEVLTLYLNGVSCEEIAAQNEVEVEVISGLLEIISAKLSLDT